ncbi:MAG: hypothetical protein MHM6MM_004463 [Cercozoa sp. M6MM]
MSDKPTPKSELADRVSHDVCDLVVDLYDAPSRGLRRIVDNTRKVINRIDEQQYECKKQSRYLQSDVEDAKEAVEQLEAFGDADVMQPVLETCRSLRFLLGLRKGSMIQHQ